MQKKKGKTVVMQSGMSGISHAGQVVPVWNASAAI